MKSLLILSLYLFVVGRLFAETPNILLIYADDLGYGDVACYNPESNIPTPHIDRLASEGMRFTDAHSAATVCTPSRYSLLTGRMAFRTGLKGVFVSPDGPCLIEEDRLTLPEILKEKGYATALFGKWHLGMTFLDKQGDPVETRRVPGVQMIDFSRPSPDGPVDRGFDTFFGTSACPTTDHLYAYIENDRVPVPPNRLFVREESDLPDHPFAHDCRDGMIAPNFDHETVDLVFLEKSVDYLEKHVAVHPDKPFFLMHSMQAVHLPSFPADSFKGKTASGPHGDFIFEMDYIVGELLQTLERLGLEKNTLVIFASDNGPERSTSVLMREQFGHDPARPWRGLKRDQWEGGHRTPLIVRWPGKVATGSVSDQLLSQTDIMATIAALVGEELPDDTAEDSVNMLPVLLGEQGDEPVRTYMLQQAINLNLSIRKGDWKYLDHQGSGGNDYIQKAYLTPYILEELAPDAPGQLYNLAQDPGERRNLYNKHPEMVEHLKAKLEELKANGRGVH